MSGDVHEFVSSGLPVDGIVPLDIGVAISALRVGKGIYRDGWDRNTVRVKLIAAPLGGDDGRNLVIPALFDEGGGLLDYWHPSPADLLAEDWHFE